MLISVVASYSSLWYCYVQPDPDTWWIFRSSFWAWKSNHLKTSVYIWLSFTRPTVESMRRLPATIGKLERGRTRNGKLDSLGFWVICMAQTDYDTATNSAMGLLHDTSPSSFNTLFCLRSCNSISFWSASLRIYCRRVLITREEWQVRRNVNIFFAVR